MDLNICLFCEKPLPEDNMSFCSVACQAQEASKNHGFVILDRAAAVDPFHKALHHHQHPSPASSTNFHERQKRNVYTHALQAPSSPSVSSLFESSYYRRRSFYLPKDSTPKPSAPSMSDSFSSEDSSASSMSFFASYPYADDPVASANMQLYNPQPTCIKNNISRPASEMDGVYTLL